MLKKVIAGWNAAPGAPANWDPARDGECGALPIRVSTHADGTTHFRESAWEPAPEELRGLNAGDQMVLPVIAWQMPAAPYVEPPPRGPDMSADTLPEWLAKPWIRGYGREGDCLFQEGGVALLFLVDPSRAIGEDEAASAVQRVLACVNALAGIDDPVAFVSRARTALGAQDMTSGDG